MATFGSFSAVNLGKSWIIRTMRPDELGLLTRHFGWWVRFWMEPEDQDVLKV